MRPPVRHGPTNGGRAVGAKDHHLPAAGRAALGRHDMVCGGLVQAHGTPDASNLHFAGMRLGLRHACGVPCRGGSRQPMNGSIGATEHQRSVHAPAPILNLLPLLTQIARTDP